MKTLRTEYSGLSTRNLISDPYVVRRATQQAWALVRTAGFRSNEWEDLRQELLLDLLRRAPQYNPSLSEWWAFVRGVMWNHATVLAARKRRFTEREVFLEDLSVHERRRVDSRLGMHNMRTEPESRVDIRRVVSGLPPPIKEIVELLPDYSIPEICEKTGTSRSHVYRTRDLARDHFTRLGLRRTRTRRSVRS